MEHVFSKEVVDDVCDFTFQLIKEKRTLHYDSRDAPSSFVKELNNVGLDTLLNLKHLSCYNVTLKIDDLSSEIDAVASQKDEGHNEEMPALLDDLLEKTKKLIQLTVERAFDESNEEHSQRRGELLKLHYTDLECKIIGGLLRLSFYSRLLEIEQVGPVIDGDLVLQGVTVLPSHGPSIAIVEFSPSTSSDHHVMNTETYTEIMRIMPWQMMFASPSECGGSSPFAVPIQLPYEYKSLAGSVRVRVYCDDVSSVPYNDEVPDFSITENMVLVYDIFTPSIIGDTMGESFDPETGITTFNGGASLIGESAPLGAHFRKVVNVQIATDYDDMSSMRDLGYDLVTTKVNGDSHPDLIDDSSQYWRFHIMTEYSPDVIFITPEGQLQDTGSPIESEGLHPVQYIADVMFVIAAKGEGLVPEVDGYEINFDMDLSDLEDTDSIYLAVKRHPEPSISSVEMVYCNSIEGGDPLTEYLHRRGLDKGHCKYVEAPHSIQDRNGGKCGILLAYIVRDLSLYDMSHHRHNDYHHHHHSKSHAHTDEVIVVDEDVEPDTLAAAFGVSQDGYENNNTGMNEEKNDETFSVRSKLSDDMNTLNEDEEEETEEEICERLKVKIEDMEKEKSDTISANLELQKKALALFLKEKSMQLSSKKGDGEEEQLSVDQITLKEKQYKDTVVAISNGQAKLKKQDSEFNALAFDLQQRLDDKEYRANVISESFKDFKKEILSKAIDSRSGKAMPAKLVKKFELAENKWEEDLEKVRLKNISLRMQLKKLERQLKATEQVAEGLHMIDFEQLKIENQTLNEKIEERQEDLNKLKRKKTITVQVLSHIREKLHFIANKNSSLQVELSGVEGDILGKRAELTGIKKDKDTVKVENKELKRKQGFSTNPTLLNDFSKGHNLMDMKLGGINEFKEKASLLTGMIRENEKTIEYNSFSKKGSYNTAYK